MHSEVYCSESGDGDSFRDSQKRRVEVGSQMNEYQKNLIRTFFSQTHGLSPAVCHEIAAERFPSQQVKVEPVDYHGSFTLVSLVF